PPCKPWLLFHLRDSGRAATTRNSPARKRSWSGLNLPDGTGVIPPAALPRPSGTGSGPATPAHLLSRIGIVRCSRRAARQTDLRRLHRELKLGGAAKSA